MYRPRIIFETDDDTKNYLGRLPYGSLKVIFNQAAGIIVELVKQGKFTVLRRIVHGEVVFTLVEKEKIDGRTE